MNINELVIKAKSIIEEITLNGKFPKENNLVDYKLKLNIAQGKSNEEIFLMNFAKDIISFGNADGGIILIGVKEDNVNGQHTEVGLDPADLGVLATVDLNDITQKFESIVKVGVSIDLQLFQIGTKKFYYLIIEKNNTVLVPTNDFPLYKLTKGAILYRASSKNEHANKSTTDFNRFLQIKANERSKEFMEIWSKLLPEMFDINPREVLILNPIQNKIYGFNSKDNILSSGDIEIDKTESGIFNIILETITAGEIGKITTDEGKPLYKIIGEVQQEGEKIILSSLEKNIQSKAKYKFTNVQLKKVIHYLKWVTSSDFVVVQPPPNTVNNDFKQFIWVGTMDSLSNRKKIYFSSEAIPHLVAIMDDTSLHQQIFGLNLKLK